MMGLAVKWTERELLDFADAACEHEDGETGMLKCCLIEAERRGLSEEFAMVACKAAERQAALEAGIPESVVDGKSKLSDHFSKEYIDHKCGRKS